MSRTAARPPQNEGQRHDQSSNQVPAEFDELMSEPIAMDSSAIAAITRAETDVQISTAKKYPRSIHQSKALATTMATISVETAASCFYKLPRKSTRDDGGQDQKYIEGPSVRLAEIFASAWGNFKQGARIIEEADRFVVAQGNAHDLQANSSSSSEVRRRITNRHGKRYSDDMIITTANAACAIARRNAIFQVIPRCYVDEVMVACKKVAIGDAKTLPQRRIELMEFLSRKLGLEEARVLATIERKNVEDVTLEDMETLWGLVTAIRDTVTTIDDAFPPLTPRQETPPPPGKAANLANQIMGNRGATDSQPPPPDDANQLPAEEQKPADGKPEMTAQEFDEIAKKKAADAAAAKQATAVSAADDLILAAPWPAFRNSVIDTARANKVSQKEAEGGIFKFVQQHGGNGEKLSREQRIELMGLVRSDTMDYGSGKAKAG